MQFTKVHLKLAKPVYEAIKTLAERQEKKCPECKGMGKIRLTNERIRIQPRYTHIECSTCKGTGKIKGKWEWKAEKGDWFISPMDCLHLISECEKLSEDYRKECIPLLHWEDHLEPTLEELGWDLWDMERTVPSSDGTGSLVVVGLAKGESVKSGRGKDRQEAFQRAVLAVAEGLEAREGA